MKISLNQVITLNNKHVLLKKVDNNTKYQLEVTPVNGLTMVANMPIVAVKEFGLLATMRTKLANAKKPMLKDKYLAMIDILEDIQEYEPSASPVAIHVRDNRHDRNMVAVIHTGVQVASDVEYFTVLIPYEAYRNIGVTACLQAGARKSGLRASRCRTILGALAQGAKYLGC